MFSRTVRWFLVVAIIAAVSATGLLMGCKPKTNADGSSTEEGPPIETGIALKAGDTAPGK